MTVASNRKPPTAVVDVHVVIRKNDGVLLQLRQNTGFYDGFYHLPSGHVEENESALEAAQRESREELGISVAQQQLQFVFALHQYSAGSRVGFFFSPLEWIGTPTIMEPEKCAELVYFPIVDLPKNMVPYARYSLQAIQAGRAFARFGWRYPQDDLEF